MLHPFMRSPEELLCSTLLKLQQTPDVCRDYPALVELKRHIVRAIADLETKKPHSSNTDIDSGLRRLRGAA